MSWNVSLSLSNLFQAVKLLQSTAITNPLTANLQLNNFTIQSCPVIQGGTAGGLSLQNSVGTITALSYPSNGIITFGVGLITPYTQYSDSSSQSTANDLYITGTIINTTYPIAMLGSNTTGRTSAYTDGAGHLNYNPSTNQLNINNNGKLVLNGATSSFTFAGTINTFSTTVFSYIMNILTQNNNWSGTSTHTNLIQMNSGNPIYFNNPANTQSMRILTDATNNLQIANQGGTNVASISQSGLISSSSLTFTSTINTFSTTVFSYIMNILTQNNNWSGTNTYTNLIQMNGGNPIYFNNPANTQSMRILTDATNNLQIANQSGSNVASISQSGLITGTGLSATSLITNSVTANAGSNISYNVNTGYNHNFNINSVNCGTIDVNGITVSSGKTLFSNNFTFISTSNDMIYDASVNRKHSFQIKEVESVFIDSTGISGNLNNSAGTAPSFSAYFSSGQSLTLGSSPANLQKLNFNATRWNTTVASTLVYSTSTYRFTVPAGFEGIYRFTLGITTGANNQYMLAIYVNGTQYFNTTSAVQSGFQTMSPVSLLVNLTASQYVEAYGMTMNSTSTTSTDASFCCFQGEWVRSTTS
jgi:hypothetical protein